MILKKVGQINYLQMSKIPWVLKVISLSYTIPLCRLC